MRAALPAAGLAPGVIARICSQRVDTAFALVFVGPARVAEQGEYRVNLWGTGVLVAERSRIVQVFTFVQDQARRR